MSYADKDLDAMRETGKAERFYAERAGTAIPGIVRLVERLAAAEAVCRVQELLADWHESAGHVSYTTSSKSVQKSRSDSRNEAF